MGIEAERATDSGQSPGFRADIEGLRGIAVLLVVLYHAGWLSNAAAGVPGGFIGVDLFFVISGYLITGLLIRERERTGRIGFARFYARRVRRILPAAAVVLLITIPLSYALVTLLQRPATMDDAASAALSIANVRFAITTDYFHPATNSPFLHFWSLGVEEQFYFVWPALLALVAWRRPRAGAGVALTVLVVVSFAASLLITDANPSWAFYMLPTRAWQLAAGGLLAVVVLSPDRVPPTLRRHLPATISVVGWLALAALVVDAFAISSATPYPGLAAVVPTLAGVALIATGAEARGPGAILRTPPVRFLGKISYSLYLWHWPILILGGIWLNGPLGIPTSIDGPTAVLEPGQALVLAALAVPAAAASWAFVEEPFRRGRIPLPRPGRLVGVGVAAMLAVAIAGAGLGLAAQSAIASVDGPPTAEPTGGSTAEPSADVTEPPASATPSPTPGVALPNISPSASPSATPTPGMTPVLTLAPEASPPTSFAITADIRPRLGQAPVDYELAWKKHCLAGTVDATPYPVGTCVFGDQRGTFRVALVGDSHASAFFPAVDEVAVAHGWRLDTYLKMDCPFTDMAMYNKTLKREYTECEAWNRRVVSRLAADPPDLVIVDMNRYMVGSESTADGQGRAMGRQLQKLPSKSIVILVKDIPYPWNENVPDCLSVNTGDYRRCAYAQTVALATDFGLREDLAAATAGVPLIDPYSWVCPTDGDCPVVVNGMIVFRDTHHLTATFAASLGPRLDEAIVEILVTRQAAPPP